MKKISCDSLFGTDEMLRHCPFQNYITLFSPPPPSFFIAIQSWPGRHGIKFSTILRFFSLHWGVPHLKYPHKTNAPPLPFPKLYCTFFSPTQFFKKAIQSWPDRHFIKFLQVYKFFSLHGGCHILNTQTKPMLHHCPFQNYFTLFTPPTQIFFISIQSWRGTRDIKFSSLYNFFLFIGGRHIKFRQKINAPPLPFPKPYYTFFYAPPYFFNSPSNLARQIKNSILKAWIL